MLIYITSNFEKKKEKKRGEKASYTYQNHITEEYLVALKDNCSENNERQRWKKNKNDDDNKGKNWKDIKIKKQIQRGGVTRPPSQFESYSLSASSKSYSGRSYSAPKPD